LNRWSQLSLFSLIELQRGFDLPEGQRRDGDVPVVASTSIVGWHNEARVGGPGVVIGRSGSIGGARWIKEDFWPLNTTLWVKDFRGNDRLFIYYLLRSIDFSRFNAGTGVPTLNRNHLTSVDVQLPPLDEQRAIARVLGALDDKIESNGRMSQITVDLMITTWQLYASTSQPGKIGGLVSNSTVRVGDRTADVVVLSATAAGQLVRSDEFFKKQVYSKNISKYLLVPPWSFAYNPSRANIGSIGLNVGPETGAVSPVYVVAQAAGPAESWWLELALRTESVRNDIAAFSSGSVRQVLRFHDLASIGIPLPDSTQLRSFFSELSPLIEVRQRNEKESGSLAALRDALLPELLSGRLRVRDAEKAVEGVV